MVEEAYDTYIDFGLDDEATSFASPSDSQTLPPFLVEILAALNSGPPSFQVEARAANALLFPSSSAPPAPPSACYAQSISPSYYPFPTPSSSLRSSFSEHYPPTCVRPCDTIRVHGLSPAPPAPSAPPAFFVFPAPAPPNPYVYAPPTHVRHTPTKRPREQMEDSGRREQSSPWKRQRAAPPCASVPDIDHGSNTIYDHPHIPEVMVEAAAREPAVPSMDWGILPGPSPESGNVAGPSVIDIENVPAPRKSRKRAPKDKTQSDGPVPSRKRHKKTVLYDAPEILNAPVTPCSGLHSVDYGPLPAPAAIQAPAPISARYPELTPEFYEELYNIASEIVQELKQASGANSTPTHPNVPGTSTTTHNVREDSPEPPSATTKSKRRRPQSSPKPPRKRQRTTDHPTNANVLPPAIDTAGTKPETPEKPFGCFFENDTEEPCRTRFGRETDIKRHVRNIHLGYKVFCTHEIHRGDFVQLAREDGVFRHLKFHTCIGRTALEALVKEREEAMRAKLGAEKKKDESDAEKKRWTTRAKREVSKDYTLCRMPCYHTRRFWRGIARMPGETPHKLETHFAKYGRVERCSCGPCQNISEEEMRGEVKIAILDEDQAGSTHASPTAGPTAGPSSSDAVTPAAGPPESLDVITNTDDDDKLPPEEEEGVDEDLPQVSPPVTDTVDVVEDNDAITTTHPSEDVPPELQAVYEILSGLQDADLESILRGSDGSQSEVCPTPDGKADA